MGLPIKHRKKFVSHKKRWDKKTIEEDQKLVNDYALKNKKEIKKFEYKLSKFKDIAKELNRSRGSGDIETEKFLEKLKKSGYLPQESESLDSVLDISLRDLLDRRLSNLVHKHKIARSPKQARQFIVHRHIKVGGKVIDSPSYLVPLELESTIEVIDTSALADENHPERRMFSEEIAKLKDLNEDIPVEEKENGKTFDEKEAELDDEEISEEIE